MGRMEELELRLEELSDQLDKAEAAQNRDEARRIDNQIDSVEAQLHTYDDTWVPNVTDTDYNELG
ncbi:MAG: hypothetical protein LUF87_09565 [Alistipes sp.]|nr:hypothetical protein [Alistipes sp.]